MYKLLVVLQVKDFAALEEFERQAAVVMAEYSGAIVEAAETSRNADGSGEEVHLLEFASAESFAQYRSDGRLSELSGLRDRAISATEVRPILKEKSYGNNSSGEAAGDGSNGAEVTGTE